MCVCVPPHTIAPRPQGLRSGTQTVGCFVSLYLLSPRLTALLLLVLPLLVGAGALIGAVLRSLSRRAQEQVTPRSHPPTPTLPPPPGGPHRPPGAGAGGAPQRSPPPSLSPQVAKATTVADEALGNVRTVRAFAMEDRQAG